MKQTSIVGCTLYHYFHLFFHVLNLTILCKYWDILLGKPTISRTRMGYNIHIHAIIVIMMFFNPNLLLSIYNNSQYNHICIAVTTNNRRKSTSPLLLGSFGVKSSFTANIWKQPGLFWHGKRLQGSSRRGRVLDRHVAFNLLHMARLWDAASSNTMWVFASHRGAWRDTSSVTRRERSQRCLTPSMHLQLLPKFSTRWRDSWGAQTNFDRDLPHFRLFDKLTVLHATLPRKPWTGGFSSLLIWKVASEYHIENFTLNGCFLWQDSVMRNATWRSQRFRVSVNWRRRAVGSRPERQTALIECLRSSASTTPKRLPSCSMGFWWSWLHTDMNHYFTKVALLCQFGRESWRKIPAKLSGRSFFPPILAKWSIVRSESTNEAFMKLPWRSNQPKFTSPNFTSPNSRLKALFLGWWQTKDFDVKPASNLSWLPAWNWGWQQAWIWSWFV